MSIIFSGNLLYLIAKKKTQTYIKTDGHTHTKRLTDYNTHTHTHQFHTQIYEFNL